MFSIPEKTIFPRTDAECPGFDVVGDNAAVDALALDLERRGDCCGGISQTTEIDVVRHYTRLSTLNFDIDRGMYPLGSCTMKHNPKLNEAVAADPHWAFPHPYWPEKYLEGHHTIMAEIERDLREVSGFDRVSLLPAAGAHGELTSVFMIKAYHEDRGNHHKKIVLTPDTSHGTNPASAAMAGFVCKQIPSGPDGFLRYEDVEPHLTDEVAAIMVTNPNTLGIYERDFTRIAEAIHALDGLVYMDGANFNAIMGIFQPGKIGADVMHWNLHKTFTTPHGGGGPGSGPIGYNENLAPYAPESGDPRSIGPVKAFLGQWGMFIRTWCYIRALGAAGLKRVSEEAIINANYLRHELEDTLHLPYSTPTLHEAVFTDHGFPNGLITKDLAKRLIDWGFHPPTVYFPIMVEGAIMIEPTETETKAEIDRFVAAVKAIRKEMDEEPDLVRGAPYTTIVRRVDETLAARNLDLRHQPD
ncbi:MAG: aminomethyl-transferring glycine dehydrogenase subunit GcvPB [Planctomycetes bacterium]|nr:aminomethyl-transferring glycine dehydrogenase subunit GcvPB [Planctomycetota bacterium]